MTAPVAFDFYGASASSPTAPLPFLFDLLDPRLPSPVVVAHRPPFANKSPPVKSSSKMATNNTVTTLPATILPPGFRLRRTISTALYGAVLECECETPATPTAAVSLATAPRRRPSLAVKTVSLTDAERVAANSDRPMDDPWQEWHVASQLTDAERVAANSGRPMDDPWQEWHVASQLIASGGHRNVLQFYQQIEQDGTLFLVSEYCAGGDLYDFMSATPTGTIPENEALSMLKQIVEGVQFLHNTIGVAHRDLSLENVLLRNGVCKLSDFGLSMEATQRSKDCVGKEYYMAPEVVAEEEYDPCVADIWSLGIMLFIMLTGSPLLPVASRAERGFATLASHGVVPVLCAWGVRDQFSDSCVDLLAQMLQVNPSKRIDIDGILSHVAFQR